MSVPAKIAFKKKCDELNQKLNRLQNQQESLSSAKIELDEKLSKMRDSEEKLNNAFSDILNKSKECINNISGFLNNLEKDSQEYKPFNTLIGEMKSLVEQIKSCIFSLANGNQNPSKECMDAINNFLFSMKILKGKLKDAEEFLSEYTRVKRTL